MFSDDFELVIMKGEFNEPELQDKSMSDVLADLDQEGIETSNSQTEIIGKSFSIKMVAIWIKNS